MFQIILFQEISSKNLKLRIANGPGWDSPPMWVTSDSIMVNSSPVAFPTWYNYYTWQGDGILDDGTMTGNQGGGWIMGLEPHFSRMSGCDYKQTWPGYLCDWFDYGYSHIGIGGVSDSYHIIKYFFAEIWRCIVRLTCEFFILIYLRILIAIDRLDLSLSMSNRMIERDMP